MNERQNIARQISFKPGHLFWWVLGGGVVLGGGLLALQMWKKDNKKEVDIFPPDEPGLPETPAPKPATTPGAFPLRASSRGPLVKLLQQALMAKYGAGILPRYGADGAWGNETTTALESKGLPLVITETIFRAITGGNKKQLPGNSLDADSVAGTLHLMASRQNLPGIIAALKSLSSPKDYVSVSEVFKTKFLRGVRQTLVTGLLHSFAREDQKQAIRNEFLRMGLQYDGSRWHVPGLSGFAAMPELITTRPAQVFDHRGRYIRVPAMTIVGRLLKLSGGYVQFLTRDNRVLFVRAGDVKKLR